MFSWVLCRRLDSEEVFCCQRLSLIVTADLDGAAVAQDGLSGEGVWQSRFRIILGVNWVWTKLKIPPRSASGLLTKYRASSDPGLVRRKRPSPLGFCPGITAESQGFSLIA